MKPIFFMGMESSNRSRHEEDKDAGLMHATQTSAFKLDSELPAVKRLIPGSPLRKKGSLVPFNQIPTLSRDGSVGFTADDFFIVKKFKYDTTNVVSAI